MNLAGNEKRMTRANHYISEGVRKQLGATLFPAGSIVFAKVGAAVFLERKRILAQPSCIDNNMAAFVLDPARADIEFVHQLLQIKRLGDLVSATALPALNSSDLASMPISLPPVDFQVEVASALERADALLAKLDQLIAKKRDLKQAAMQQLLGDGDGSGARGATLPVVPLSKICDFISKGSTPTTYGFKWEASGVLFLRSECVSENGLDLSQSMFISPAAHAALRRTTVRDGDLLITITGNVGRVVRFDAGCEANINQHIARIRVSSPDVDAGYVFHVLSQPSYRVRFNSITTGQAYPQLSLKQVRDAGIPFRSLPEQKRIAGMLSDMDTELADLEARRDKTRQLKQGMMQALLTGRIRLT
jgi:type I restriction enzyme S subunit